MAVNRIARAALKFLLMLTMVNMGLLWGQSGTSSAVAGSVLDSRGAAIPVPRSRQPKSIPAQFASSRATRTGASSSPR